MTTLRLISLPAHGAVELLFGLALMVAPFALGLGAAPIVVAAVAGALVVGVALTTLDESYGSIAGHHASDTGLAVGMLVAGAALAVAHEPAGATLLALAALVQTALMLTTRYSAAR